jgi:hypothetical protein
LNIETFNLGVKQKLEIFNIMGQNIYNHEFTDKIKLNVKDFQSGIYFVKVYSDKSSTIIKRFIKQ